MNKKDYRTVGEKIIAKLKEENKALKKKANLMEQYQFDSRIEADRREWAEKKIEDLEKEIEVADKLIAERDRILEKYPCPEHGKCVPYILEQLAELNILKEEGEKDYKDLRRFQDKYIKADHELRALREKVENLEAEINYLYEQGDL